MKTLTSLRCSVALIALLLLPTFSRATEVELESFEWNPMVPAHWPQPALGGTPLDPGLHGETPWFVAQGDSSSLVQVVDSDAANGAQSLVITKGANGNLTRLELAYQPPLAGLLPVYVDFWLRPTAWSGSTGVMYQLPSTSSEGAQIFVDGHFFAFQHSNLNDTLRLNYYDFVPQAGAPAWKTATVSVPVPVWERSNDTLPVSAKDWVRCTVRVDPVSGRADVWLNGTLCITDAPRSSGYLSAYPEPLLGRPFYIQGSTRGPLGFDSFQATPTNPLFGDMDADGLPDDWELAHGLNISANDRAADLDDDTLTNLEEFLIGTSPDLEDTDGDGMPDDWEHGFHSQALNPLSALDANQDPDFDGWSNVEEFLEGTDPLLNAVAPPNRTVIYVKPGAYGTQNGTFDFPFSTLVAAMAAPQFSSGTGTRIIEVIPGSGSLRGPGNVDITISAVQGDPVPILIRGNGVWIDGSEINTTTGSYAAHSGIKVTSGSLCVEDVFFYFCGRDEGGAVLAEALDPGDPVSVTLRRCQFTGAKATDDGGAVRFYGLAAAVVEDCLFTSCTAADKGGALSAEGCPLTIHRCRFSGNQAVGDGGALHANACTGVVENCLFLSNSSGQDGGAAALKNGSTTALRFCTFLNNTTWQYGGAVFNSTPATSIILNSCILWNNSAAGAVSPNKQAYGPWTATYTTAQSQTWLPASSTNNTLDPLFQNTFNLRPTSPAINTADTVHPLTDIDGNLREANAADRGCSEFSDRDGDGMADSWEAGNGLNASSAADRDTDADQDGFTNYEEWLARTNPVNASFKPPGVAIYVNPVTGVDTRTGSSVSLPVKSIKRAIALCSNSTPRRICLMDGTYSGADNRNLTTNPGGTAKKFYLRSINGKGRVTVDLENLGRFLTIENGAFDGACGIEGITIRRGKALYQSGVANSDNGGAILVKNTSSASQPFIANCTIAGSEADGQGGAVCVSGGSLFLYNSELFANRADYGGAVSVLHQTSAHTVFGLNCTLAYNTALDSSGQSGGGGAIACSGNICWKGGSIFRNVAVYGGALYMENTDGMPGVNWFSGTGAVCSTQPGFPASSAAFNSDYYTWLSRPHFAGTRISENDAWTSGDADDPKGGAISIMGSWAFLERLTIENNNAAGGTGNDGGGIWITTSDAPNIYGCILRGNKASGNGGAIATIPHPVEPVGLYACALCDNTAAGSGGALYAHSSYAGWCFTVTHCTLTYNTSASRVISTDYNDDPENSNWAVLSNNIIYYNHTPSGSVTDVSPTSLKHPSSTRNVIENVGSTNRPAFAWDHYHLLKTISIPDAAPILGNGTARDIDGELRPTGNPVEPGCDEWTDSIPSPNGDGVPDWYEDYVSRLLTSGTVSPGTTGFAGRKLWGPNGPSVIQVFNEGFIPSLAFGSDNDGDAASLFEELRSGADPDIADTDHDGLNDGEEITLGLEPTRWSTAWDGRCDSEAAGIGRTHDFDGDGVMDADDAVPNNSGFTFWRAPEMRYVEMPLPDTFDTPYPYAINDRGDVVLGNSNDNLSEACTCIKVWNAAQQNVLTVPFGIHGTLSNADFVYANSNGQFLFYVWYNHQAGAGESPTGYYVYDVNSPSALVRRHKTTDLYSIGAHAEFLDSAGNVLWDLPEDYEAGVDSRDQLAYTVNEFDWLITMRWPFDSPVLDDQPVITFRTGAQTFTVNEAQILPWNAPYSTHGTPLWMNSMDRTRVNSGPIAYTARSGYHVQQANGQWLPVPRGSPRPNDFPGVPDNGLLSGSLVRLNNQGVGTVGVASSYGGISIWRNNSTVYLHRLIDPPLDGATSHLGGAHLNNNGLIAVTIYRDFGPEHASLLIPIELAARDADTGEIRPVLASEFGNTPIPDVTLHVVSAIIRPNVGALEVVLSGTVRDKLSEVLDDRSKWVQSLKFKVNGDQVDVINDLPTWAGDRQGTMPWQPHRSDVPFTRTLVIPGVKRKAYLIRAVTSENAAGRVGYDDCSIVLHDPEPPDGPPPPLPVPFAELTFAAVPNLTSTDSLSFVTNTPALQVAGTLLESGPDTQEFSGAAAIGSTAGAARIRVAGKLNGSPVRTTFSAVLEYWTDPQQKQVVYGTWTHQSGTTYRLTAARPYTETSMPNNLQVVSVQDLDGSPTTPFAPAVFRMNGIPASSLAAGQGIECLFNGQAKSLQSFTYSPEYQYIIRSDEDGKPEIFVLSGDDLPDNLDAAVLNLNADNEWKLKDSSGNEIGGVDVGVMNPDFGVWNDDHTELADDTLTVEILLTYYKMLYGEEGMIPLRAVMAAALEANSDWLEFEMTSGDCDFNVINFGGRPPYVEMDPNQDPIAGANCLWAFVQKVIGEDEVVAYLPDSYTSDPDKFAEIQKQAWKNSIDRAVGVTNAYTGLIEVVVGTVAEPFDMVISLSSVADGNYAAAIGLLPFVPAGITKVVIKKAGGELFVEWTAEEAARIAKYMSRKRESATGMRFHTMRQIESDLDAGLLDTEDIAALYESGFLKVNKGSSRSFLGILLGPKPNNVDSFAAHHDLPLEFENRFLAVGLEPNDPRWGRWVEKNVHDGFHGGTDRFRGGFFNAEWRRWLNLNKNASREAILDKMIEMRQEYSYP